MRRQTIQDLEAALTRLVGALRSAFEAELQAVVLYGSAAVDDFLPGESDVNLLVLLREVTPAALRRAKRPLDLWPDEPDLIPLFLSPPELAASADVFPIELLDMRDRHRLLWGEDPLRGLEVDPAALRRQLESELRGKWLRLRQAYLRDSGDPVALRSLMRESLSTFQALFAAALRLHGDPEPPHRHELFARAWEVFDLDATVLERAVAVKEGHPGWPDTEMESAFERYILCVERVLTWVDQYRECDQ
jgi:predicted nucleotidyltransferase